MHKNHHALLYSVQHFHRNNQYVNDLVQKFVIFAFVTNFEEL
jgi:hypothetical protein